MSDSSATNFANLESFYQAVDQQARQLSRLHQSRLQCRSGCAGCCQDGLTVWRLEADYIAAKAASLLNQQNPSPRGACAFLDQQDQSCRIYHHRPYVCRTQGLPLQFMELVEEEWVAYRTICELNEAGTPLEALPEDACWLIGPNEQQLAQLQSQYEAGKMTRRALRSLFSKQTKATPDGDPPTGVMEV